MTNALIKNPYEVVEQSVKNSNSTLLSSLTMSVSDIAGAQTMLKGMLNNGNKNEEAKKEIKKRIEDLEQILLMRIDFNKILLKSVGVKETVLITNPQLNIEFSKTENEEITDRKVQIEQEVELKEGPKYIKHDFTKKQKTPISFPPAGAGKVSFQLSKREGKPDEVTVNRFKVFGTGYSLPEAAQRILANNVETESQVRELILEIHRWGLEQDAPFNVEETEKIKTQMLRHSHDLAINLYLDLMCVEGIGKLTKLTPEKALEKYIDEIIPWVDSTLTSETVQTEIEEKRAEGHDRVKEVVEKLFNDYNEQGIITKSMKIYLENSPCKRWYDPTLKVLDEEKSYLINKRVRLTQLLKEAKINPVDFIVEDAMTEIPVRIYNWNGYIRNASGEYFDGDNKPLIEKPKLKYSEVEELVKNKLRENDLVNARELAIFYLENSSRTTSDQKGDFGILGAIQVYELWEKEILGGNKTDLKVTKEELSKTEIQTPEVIESTLSEKQEENLQKVQNFIKERILSRSVSVLNEVRQFIKKAGENGKRLRLPEKIKLEEVYKKVKNELSDVYAVDPSMSTSDQRIFKRYSVKETNPSLYDKSIPFKVGPFKNFVPFIKTIAVDDNNYLDAINLVMDLNEENDNTNWSFCKGWSEEKWKTWFNKNIFGVKEKPSVIEPNTEFKETAKKEATTTVENNTEEKTQPSSEEPTVVHEIIKEEQSVTANQDAEIDKLIESIGNCIAGEKSSNILRAQIAKFLSLDYKTPQERFKLIVENYLAKNKRWLRQPINERERYVNGIIEKNDKLSPMFFPF